MEAAHKANRKGNLPPTADVRASPQNFSQARCPGRGQGKTGKKGWGHAAEDIIWAPPPVWDHLAVPEVVSSFLTSKSSLIYSKFRVKKWLNRKEADTWKLFNTFINLIGMGSDFNPEVSGNCFVVVVAFKRQIPEALLLPHTPRHKPTLKFKVCKWKSTLGASLPWTASPSKLWSLLQKRKSKVCYLHTVPTNALWKPHITQRSCFTSDSGWGCSSALYDLENMGAKKTLKVLCFSTGPLYL